MDSLTDEAHAQHLHAQRLEDARARLLAAAREAYDAAGMQGLCREGREELACEAVRSMPIEGPLALLSAEQFAELREGCLRAVGSGALEPSAH